MSFWQILRIFRARRRLMLTLFLLVAGIGTAITLLLPRQYLAEAAMVLDIKVDPILGALAPAMASPAYLATQVEIIRSDAVAQRVVKTLGLERSAKATEQWRDATEGKLPIEHYYGKLLQKGLVVEPLRLSNIINIGFKNPDPAFAAAAANAFAQAYTDMTVEMRVEPARQYATWFDEQSKGLLANLEKAQAKLSDYQREKGIVITDERIDQETSRLNQLATQLAVAQGERLEALGRQRNTGSEMSPDVQQSAAVLALKGQLAAAQTKLSEISGIVGPNHPQRQQLTAQVSALQGQLAAEIKRVSGGANVMSRGSEQKVEALKKLYDDQKKQVLSMRGERDRIAVLQRDIETAQRAYDNAGQRVSQLNLESQTNQANARVLSPAVEPIAPSNTRLIARLVLSIVGGLAVAAAVALGLELLDRRVRGPEDLIAIEGVPVLGVLRPAGSREPVFRRLALAAPSITPALGAR